MSDWQYKYKVRLLRIVDADTIDVEVDLGLNVFRNERLRFARIDAWEVRGPERAKGLRAKAALELVLTPQAELWVQTHKDKTGKYGRYIAEVWADDLNVNDWLVAEGHAEYVEY